MNFVCLNSPICIVFKIRSSKRRSLLKQLFNVHKGLEAISWSKRLLEIPGWRREENIGRKNNIWNQLLEELVNVTHGLVLRKKQYGVGKSILGVQ